MTPWIINRYKSVDDSSHRWILYLACFLFFISWYLPSPMIDGQDTSLMKHLIGGGFFSGLLWWYIKRSFNWRSNVLMEFLSLFALVSVLGCVNELAELAMVQLSIAAINLSDTNWDILVNTLGAGLIFLIYLSFGRKNET